MVSAWDITGSEKICSFGCSRLPCRLIPTTTLSAGTSRWALTSSSGFSGVPEKLTVPRWMRSRCW